MSTTDINVQIKALTDLIGNFQKSNAQLVADFMNKVLDIVKNIVPIPNPDPNPDPNPTPGGNIGPDGIKEIFPSKQGAKAKPFYINLNNPDENNKVFQCSYGSDIVKFDNTAKDGQALYVHNKGHVQNYASGAPPGKSCRFHISAGGNNGKPGKHSWKDNPLPEYVTATDECFYSHEMTAVVKVGKALGTHQSFAFKVNSRPDQPDDNLRSTIEMCMNNDQKKDPYVNYNYAHSGYESVAGVKIYTKDGKITVGQLIGVKYIHAIAADKKSTHMIMYINTDPVDLTTGKFKNDGWKLKADYIAKGIPQYQNKPPVWGGDSYLRVDGYDGVSLYAFSQREIDPTELPKLLAITMHTEDEEPYIAEVPTDNFADYEDPNELE